MCEPLWKTLGESDIDQFTDTCECEGGNCRSDEATFRSDVTRSGKWLCDDCDEHACGRCGVVDKDGGYVCYVSGRRVCVDCATPEELGHWPEAL